MPTRPMMCGHCGRLFGDEASARRHVVRCTEAPPDLLSTALSTCCWLVLAALAGAWRFFAPRG